MSATTSEPGLQVSMNQHLLVLVLLFLCSSVVPAGGLITGTPISPPTPCSRTCESMFCTFAPLLRYGKYCGFKYGGCPGEAPCDPLDACCQIHDACIRAKGDYLSVSCNQGFLDCIQPFKNIMGATFAGSQCSPKEIVSAVTPYFEAAVLLGELLEKP
ncbi:putative phospholipase A2 homolog 2 [Wolffia australiana]